MLLKISTNSYVYVHYTSREHHLKLSSITNNVTFSDRRYRLFSYDPSAFVSQSRGFKSIAGFIGNWGEPYHIYRNYYTEDLREGKQPINNRVLLHTTNTDKNHNIEVEFKISFVRRSFFKRRIPARTFLLGNTLVVTRIPESHRYGHIEPFEFDLEKVLINCFPLFF